MHQKNITKISPLSACNGSETVAIRRCQNVDEARSVRQGSVLNFRLSL